MRPGRFDTKINVPMPDVKARHNILKVHFKNVQVAEGTLPCVRFRVSISTGLAG